MESGRLRHVITVQSLATTDDGAGGITETWSDLADLRAEILTNNGSEKTSSYQTQAQSTHLIKTRYCPGITTKSRVLFNSRIFNITRVDNIKELNRYLHIHCYEEV